MDMRRYLPALGLAILMGTAGSSSQRLAPGTRSVVSAPVRVANTRLGAVGYRVVGSGPPLVLVMGYGWTMEGWDPRLVHALALHHRVVMFDNSGVGRTQELPQPFSVDAMADQTSALITALGLGRPDVLGWSMGGMIAQALAVLHPGQVRRLVLCATFPGVGGVTPPQAAINDLTNGSGVDVMYPANQAMANDAFAADDESYPSAAAVPAGVISAQRRAALWWFDGADAAGRRTSQITAATLVADGTQDQLDAMANSRTIARLIPQAKLLFYPDAGHGFLFQEGTPFAVTVESFLSGAARPASTATIRAKFLAGEAGITAAGKTWEARIKGMLSTQSASSGIGGGVSARPSAAEVAGIDQPFASAFTDLDYQLLMADATGAMGDAITTLVAAD